LKTFPPFPRIHFFSSHHNNSKLSINFS
jgi:hypothetical protein